VSLQGWSYPLSPRGRSSLVPPPPWHFSGDALVIDYRADPQAVEALTPRPFEPAGDGALSFVCVDWASSADADPRLAADPARGQYLEAFIAVHCLLDGEKVVRIPYIWVSTDLSMARGHIQGVPKKLGSIAMTRPSRVGKGGPRLESGATHVGQVSALGRMLAHGTVTLAEQQSEIPAALGVPIWSTRHVPDLKGGAPLVHDLSRNITANVEVGTVWHGPATLTVFESEYDEILELAPVQVTGGYRFEIGFSIIGAEVRPAERSEPVSAPDMR
jgi:acetoacetate decarboxylase